MRVLILGASGMLGQVTSIYLKKKGHIVTNHCNSNIINSDDFVCDICDLNRLEKFLDENHFDIIINCVALLIHASEKEKSKAIFINSYFPHWLEEKYRISSTKIIQVSTDGVFGVNDSMQSEDSLHTNTSFYAKTKSLGEISNEKDLVIRSSFYGPDIKVTGQGLFNWFFSQEGVVKGYKNVVFSGVTSLEFAKFIHTQGLYITGIYNLTIKNPISKYDLLCLIKRRFAVKSIELISEEETKAYTLIKSNRDDVKYCNKSSEVLINELYAFMKDNKEKGYYRYFDNKIEG